MPTQEEILLYADQAGGSGDAKMDAEVVGLLSQTFKIPEQTLTAFVKTRDKHTAGGLREILQKMPAPGRTNELHRAASAPAMTSPSLTSPSLTSPSRKAQRRLDEMMKMTSTYSSGFSKGGKQLPKSASPHSTAFDDMNEEYRHSFENWKKSAPDSHVRVYAEAARTLSYFKRPGLHATTYTTGFIQYDPKLMAEATTKLPSKDKSSNVPIGNIGKYSKTEHAALAAREAAKEATFEKARQMEAANRSGVGGAKFLLSGSFSGNQLGGKATQGEVEKDHPDRSSSWKALSKASWNPQMHMPAETLKHDHSRLKVGEYERKDLAMKMSFNKTMSTHTQGEKVFDVRTAKDLTGGTCSRFSYAKNSGYVP